MANIAAELLVAVNANVKGLKKGLNEAQSSLKSAGRKMERTGKTLTAALTAPLAAIGVGAVKAFTDYEDGITGVKKTVDATPAAFAALESELRGLNRRLPASQAEIHGVAEAAGQLGVETESIAGFTETMVNLGETTNLSADEAATSLARFMNVMGTSTQDVGRLGSTIVDLGNNFATTEAEITEMGSRLSGAGNQFGLTETDVLGLATALTSVGINAEAGGSAFSKVMVEMEKANSKFTEKLKLGVDTAGSDLSKFAEVAGVSAEQFATTMEERPNEAIVGFVEGIGRMQDQGENVNGTLDKLGLSGLRVSDALKRSAGAGDLMREAMQTGAKAFEENTALAKEAELRYGTLTSQLELTKQRIKEAAMEIGDNLAPVVAKMNSFISDLATRFADMSEAQQSVTIGLGSMAASLGPVLIVVGKVVAALGALGATLTGLATGAGAIVVFAGAAGLIVDNWQTLKGWFDSFYATIQGLTQSALGAVRGFWQTHRDEVIGTVNALLDNTIGIFNSLFDIIKPVVVAGLGLLRGLWNMWSDNLIVTVQTAFKGIVDLAVNLGEALEGAFDVLAGILTGDWSRLWDGIVNFTRGVWNTLITIVQTSISGMLNALEAGFSWLPVIGPKIDDARQAISDFIDENLKAEVESDSADLEASVSAAHEGARGAVESASEGIKTSWESVKAKSVAVFGQGGSGGTATDAVTSGAEQMSIVMELAAIDMEQSFAVAADTANAAVIPMTQSIEDHTGSQEEMAAKVAASTEGLEEKKKRLLEAQAATSTFDEAVQNATDSINQGLNRALDRTIDALVSGRNPLKAGLNAVKSAMKSLVSDGIQSLIKGLVKGKGGGLTGAFKSLTSTLSGGGGGGGLIGAIGGASAAVAGMLAGLEGMSRLMGGSFFGGMIRGFRDLGKAIKNAGKELSGSGLFGGGRQGGSQGSGVSAGSVGESISKIRGFNETSARQAAPSFIRKAKNTGGNHNALAKLLTNYTNESFGSIVNDFDLRKAASRALNDAPAFNAGGIVTQDTLAQLHGSPSRPEAVIPLDRLPQMMERIGGGGKQVINVYMDGERITRRVVEGMPGELRLNGLLR